MVFRKGNIPWNKGTKCSEETRQKLSLVHKGMHHSKETEFKKGMISQFKGKRFSEEHRRNLSLSHLGKSHLCPWLKGNRFRLGKPRPDLIERNKKGQTEESKLKISLALKGRPISEEHKKNISIARKGKYYPTEFKKGYHPKTEFRKGNKPWNYIDGRSKLKCPDRYGDDWDAIRLIIYMRDNYRCQECGITMNEYKRPLDVHHKIPFLISYDNSLENLITLCRSCHIKIENQLIKLQGVMLRA